MPEHQQIQQSKKPDTISQKQSTPTKQISISNPMAIIQRARINPKSLTHADVMQLQRTIGNKAVGILLAGTGNNSKTFQSPVQRQEILEEEICPLCIQKQEIPEEEEPLQGKMVGAIQRQEIPEEEEPLQGKMIETVQRLEPEEEGKLQMKTIVQRHKMEEEEPVQAEGENIIQLMAGPLPLNLGIYAANANSIDAARDLWRVVPTGEVEIMAQLVNNFQNLQITPQMLVQLRPLIQAAIITPQSRNAINTITNQLSIDRMSLFNYLETAFHVIENQFNVVDQNARRLTAGMALRRLGLGQVLTRYIAETALPRPFRPRPELP